MQADQTARQEKQGVENVFGEAGIKGGEGFVRQHEFRPLMQQTAQSHPLALPSGELTHGLFKQIGLQFHLVHQLQAGVWVQGTQQVPNRPEQPMASQGTAVDVLDHTQFLHQAQVLPERADLAPLPTGQLLMGPTTPVHGSCIGA